MEEQNYNPGVIQPETGMINRIKGIIMKPVEEWLIIENESPDTKKILMSYILPLVLLAAVCAVLGMGLIGKTVSFGFLGSVTQKGWNFGLQTGLITLISSVAGVYISALVINALAPSFKSQSNFGKSFQLVAYSFTPVWLGGVFNIIPTVSWIGSLLGLYGLYIMYLGLSPLMKTPKENAVGYLVVSILVTIIAYFLVAVVIGLILTPIFLTSVNL